MFVLTIIIYWIHVRLNPIGDIHILPDYLTYTQNMLSLNFGKSSETGALIANEMKLYFPPTIELIVCSLFVAFTIGIPLGIALAFSHKKITEKAVTTTLQLSRSIPVYWLCQILIVFFCVKLNIFPTYGNLSLLYDIEPHTGFIIIDTILTYDPDIIANMLKHLALPLISLSLIPLIEITMLSRTATLELLHTHFIRVIISRGVSFSYITRNHILRNILPYIMPHFSILLCNLISASIMVEVIFEWPGIGTWVTSSVSNADYRVLESVTFILASSLLSINILTEILMTIFYPLKNRVKIKV